MKTRLFKGRMGVVQASWYIVAMSVTRGARGLAPVLRAGGGGGRMGHRYTVQHMHTHRCARARAHTHNTHTHRYTHGNTHMHKHACMHTPVH